MRARAGMALALAAGCGGGDFRAGEGESEAESEGEAVYRCSPEGGGVFQEKQGAEWLDAGECAGECDVATNRCAESACPDGDVERCAAEDGLVERCDSAIGGFLYPAACGPGQACFAAAGGCAPWKCAPGVLDCLDEATVRACNADGSAYETTQCGADEACSGGACTTVCDAAENAHTSVGCLFYALDADNLDSPDDEYQYSIVVANQDEENDTTVSLDFKVGDEWSTFPEATVLPGEAYTFYVTCSSSDPLACQAENLMPDQHPEGTGIFGGMAFRLRSTRPIAAYQINSDDVNFVASSTGATILYPVGAIDRHYRAMAYPHSETGASWVAVVATADDTTVTVISTAATATGGVVPGLTPGDEYETVLDEGDVLQISTAAIGEDMTGTYVEGDEDLAVFSGHEDAWPGGYSFNRDYLEEQMMPLEAWGKSYVASAAPLCLNDCASSDCVFESTTFRWRVLASVDDTLVSFEADGTLLGVPSADVPLDAGEFLEFSVIGGDLNRGHFVIASDEPILVAQYLDGGPTAMALLAPDEQLLPRYGFATTEWFSDVLTITRPTGTAVEVDGAAPGGAWTAASATHEVISMGICADGVSHTVEGTSGTKGETFGIVVSGNGGVCSYAFLGGLSQERINPID